MSNSPLQDSREFLKDTIRQRIDFSATDQSRGVAPPPVEKPLAKEATRIKLLPADQCQGIGRVDLVTAIGHRQSHRKYTDEPLSLEELSFLLWATQGIRRRDNAANALRTVASAGNRHALETYVCALRIVGLGVGIYRYLPLEHELVLEFEQLDARGLLVEAAWGQSFAGQAAATLIWTAIPYRTEWRYGLASHKVIAMDAGHVCQNLYLACEAIGAGTCAVAAYHQQRMDRLVRVDGTDEFVIYLAPVGKVQRQ